MNFIIKPMHIKINIRREWLKECLYLARDNIFRLREHNIFVEINTNYLDYK